jgi:U3 small nucleolar RNA-associated protein 14
MPRVTANRKAEHLSFGEQSAVKQASSTGLVVKFQAETELEKQVRAKRLLCWFMTALNV